MDHGDRVALRLRASLELHNGNVHAFLDNAQKAEVVKNIMRFCKCLLITNIP